MTQVFDPAELKKLYKPDHDSSGEDNGQVTLIGGSELFHGAPLLSQTVASRLVDIVFFATPEKSVGMVAENVKSKLFSFIWVPWEEVEDYIAKSDAILIGPGFMRFRSEKVPQGEREKGFDEAGEISRDLTERFLKKFPEKKWVIDAGSLQVMEASWIPKGAILTPNQKEYKLLFGEEDAGEMAKKYNCTIVVKGAKAMVCSPEICTEIRNGNPGLTTGGSGDTLAGIALGLLAKNDPFLAAASAVYVTKAAADELYKKVGTNYNADDLAEKVPEVLFRLTK
jgi:NAD(P)H-hydrate epimerase